MPTMSVIDCVASKLSKNMHLDVSLSLIKILRDQLEQSLEGAITNYRILVVNLDHVTRAKT